MAWAGFEFSIILRQPLEYWASIGVPRFCEVLGGCAQTSVF